MRQGFERGRVGWGLLACALLCAGVGARPAGAAGRADKIQGMTLSTARGSAEWGRDHIVPALEDLRGLGVNWIAIHPYARIGRDGEVSWRRGEQEGAEAPVWLRRPIEEAHRQGLKILVKPHLAYWGSFSWRGEIEFDSPEEWSRFFAGYRAWIAEIARYAHDADALAVGTELDRTIDHEADWRAIIAQVRDVYAGPLTYAANWTDYERVPFWDALDAIGIQAYFPVLDRAAVGDVVPPQAEFDAGWARIMDRLRVFGERHERTIVFTELGYNLSAKAPFEPWDWEVGGPDADVLQERCMRAALAAIDREPAVVGAFLWKWFPGDRRPRDFEMSSPAMRSVISSHWRSAGSGAPERP